MTSSGSPRKTAFRVARWLIVAVVAVLLLPYLLTPLYRVIDPVSTLMLARWVTRQAGGSHCGAAAPGSRRCCRAPSLRPRMGGSASHHGIDLAELREAIEDADDLSEAQGRLDHHPADRQEPVPVAGPQLRPQGPGVSAGALDRSGAAQAAHHGNLSQYRRMGPERRVRRRGGRAPRLQQVGRAICPPARPRCWPRCCRIRSGAAPGCRGRRSAASPASSRRGRPFRSIDACLRKS